MNSSIYQPPPTRQFDLTADAQQVVQEDTLSRIETMIEDLHTITIMRMT